MRATPEILPEVDGDRCVLTAAVDASCRACVDVCPRSAWILGDGALGLNAEACDGCAICAPACPRAAITIERASPEASPNDPGHVLMACEIAVPGRGKGVMPCLDAMGLDELAGLHARGVRRLTFARGDCATCARGGRHPLDRALGDLSRLLADRGLPELVTEDLRAQAWQAALGDALRPSRRAFLMGARGGRSGGARSGAGSIREVAASPAAAPRQTAASVLAQGPRPPNLDPVAPRFDVEACIACDACARICPEGAIRLETGAAGGAGYAIDARGCTGCRLCIDVCKAGAMSLVRWQSDLPRTIALDSLQCRACGNVFRIPSGQQGGDTLCRICRTTNHNAKLYQVIG